VTKGETAEAFSKQARAEEKRKGGKKKLVAKTAPVLQERLGERNGGGMGNVTKKREPQNQL